LGKANREAVREPERCLSGPDTTSTHPTHLARQFTPQSTNRTQTTTTTTSTHTTVSTAGPARRKPGPGSRPSPGRPFLPQESWLHKTFLIKCPVWLNQRSPSRLSRRPRVVWKSCYIQMHHLPLPNHRKSSSKKLLSSSSSSSLLPGTVSCHLRQQQSRQLLPIRLIATTPPIRTAITLPRVTAQRLVVSAASKLRRRIRRWPILSDLLERVLL
jgi:hypothetical protein